MSNDKFINNNFFDLNSFLYKEILDNIPPWESIERLTDFIDSLFNEKRVFPNYKDKKDVFIGEGTYVHPSVDFDGPVIIGKNCKINHAAFFRGGSIIGDNVIIGHAVEIKHSILLNYAAAAHLNYIGDSIIGNNTNISGGAILANFRLDKQKIKIKTDDGFIDTGLEKFGTAIGDNSVIGVNSVINPGTILGKNVKVHPLKSVAGVHINSEVIK